MRDVTEELAGLGFSIVAASGRRLAVQHACEACDLQSTGIKERDLITRASEALDLRDKEIKTRVTAWGKALGPPWQQDEKLAAIAAWTLLAT